MDIPHKHHYLNNYINVWKHYIKHYFHISPQMEVLSNLAHVWVKTYKNISGVCLQMCRKGKGTHIDTVQP